MHVHAFTDGRDTSPHGACAVPRRDPRRRDGGRPVLRDGPRPPLGTGASGPTTRSCTAWAARAGRRGRGGQGELRPRRDRRVHRAGRDRRSGGGPDPVRRRGDLLQLPAGPGPRALVGAHAGRLRRLRPRARPAASALRADDRVRRRRRCARRVPGRGSRRRSGTGAGLPRRRAAPRRRDREVRPRHLLLRRRLRDALRRRGVGAGRLAARRPHLRQEAEHERRAGLPTTSSPASPTTATGSASSTSRTPTWSATPA